MKETKKGFGVSSLVCGIISVCLVMFAYFGIPLGILAIVFANKQRKIERNSYATTGLVLGIIGTVLGTIILLSMLLYISLISKLISII